MRRRGAARESARRPSVALIETGPAKASLFSDVPLGIALLVPFDRGTTMPMRPTPQAGFGGRRGYQPRGRGLGGSSLINAMIYTRGQPQDYDEWAASGCTGWGCADVLPYFKRWEDNARGARRVARRRRPAPGQQPELPQSRRRGLHRGRRAGGIPAQRRLQRRNRRRASGRIRCSSRTADDTMRRAPICQSAPPPNLDGLRRLLRRDAFCSRIGGRSASSYATRPAANDGFSRAREIVLCGGAFGSPQLLMVSGIGPAEHLKQPWRRIVADAPEVGANLHDHCDYTANLRANGQGLFGLTVPALLRSVGAILSNYLRHGADC